MNGLQILGVKEFISKEEMRKFASAQPRGLDEERVKAAICCFLEANGHTVTMGKRRERGADILADKGGQKFVIEAKGEGSRPEMFNNYFLNALGQVLQRMRSEVAEYGIALPAHEKFIRLTHELPDIARQVLRLNFYFVQSVLPEKFNVLILGWNTR